METSLLLARQIAQILLMVIMGFVLVRTKLLKKEDSRILSVIALYILAPCIIVVSFQIEYSPEVRDGLLLAFAAAIGIHAIFILVTRLLAKPLKLDVVERMSIIYTNSINMIVLLVNAILGPDWIVYSSAYMTVQLILQWTHCLCAFRGDTKVDVGGLLRNPNLIAVGLGVLLFFTKIQLPSILEGTLSSVGNMIGPVSMLVTGMLIGGMDLAKLLEKKRALLVVALRMLVLPVIVLAAVKLSGAARLVPNGEAVLMISFLAASAPAATSITQMAQVYGQDGEYASVINVITLLVCIVTMPVLVWFYQQ